MNNSLQFTISVDQHRYTSTDATQLHAILRIAARSAVTGQPETRQGRGLAVVIVVDCSGSMGKPATKIAAARGATHAALDTLPDGVLFAVVQGDETATMCYPPQQRLVAASPATRRQAKAAVTALAPAGGTAIGAWLSYAADLLAPHPTAIGHVLLLTDGKNEHETAETFEQKLADCRERFVCDARGIGDGWDAKQLVRIATVLHGSAKAVRQPEELEDDFRETMNAAVAKVLPAVALRITCADKTQVAFLRQVHPAITTSDDQGSQVGDNAVEFTTGSWGAEEKHFHLCLTVDGKQASIENDLRAARIDVVVDGQMRASPAVVLVHWTHDPVLSGLTNSKVDEYRANEQISELITRGFEAYEQDDRQVALELWTRAHGIAKDTPDSAIMQEIENLVEDDPEGDGLRLKDDLTRLDRNHAVVAASQSSFYEPANATAAEPPFSTDHPAGVCSCGVPYPPDATFCSKCRKQLKPAADAAPTE